MKERKKERKRENRRRQRKKKKSCVIFRVERDIYGETSDKWWQRERNKMEKKRRDGEINNNHKYESKQLK